MDKYLSVVYPEDNGNTYPRKLCKYLIDRFDIKEGSKLIDLGCGDGQMVELFREYKVDAAGADKRISTERDKKIYRAMDFEISPYKDLGYGQAAYERQDFVYSKSLIEHIRDYNNFINAIKHMLKPGGKFVILTPDWKSAVKWFWDDYTHTKPFTRKSLRDMMLVSGFKNVECEYFYQLPFVWNNKSLEVIPKIIGFLTPDSWRWKDSDERNTKDNKLIRFSKEKMLLCYGEK